MTIAPLVPALTATTTDEKMADLVFATALLWKDCQRQSEDQARLIRQVDQLSERMADLEAGRPLGSGSGTPSARHPGRSH